MNEVSKKAEENILNGNVNNDVVAPQPKKKSLLVRLALYPFEVLKIILGIDKDSLKKADQINSYVGKRGYSSSDTWREGYKVDTRDHHAPTTPQPDLVKYANLMEYLDAAGIETHDCDHEH